MLVEFPPVDQAPQEKVVVAVGRWRAWVLLWLVLFVPSAVATDWLFASDVATFAVAFGCLAMYMVGGFVLALIRCPPVHESPFYVGHGSVDGVGGSVGDGVFCAMR